MPTFLQTSTRENSVTMFFPQNRQPLGVFWKSLGGDRNYWVSARRAAPLTSLCERPTFS